ncbi:hypothetical protein ABEF95_001650 [Exophiala dermatitidis]
MPGGEGDEDGPPALFNWTEAGCYGGGMADDMARFMADLEMYKGIVEHSMGLDYNGVDLAARKDLESLGLALTYLSRGLLKGYKRQSKLYSNYYMKPNSRSTWLEKWKQKRQFDKPSLIAMERSAYFAHALRIINLAFERSWRCFDPKCVVDGQHTAVKKDCTLVQMMVRRGLWFFRRSMVDEATFASSLHRGGTHTGVGWPGAGRPWLAELFARKPELLFGDGDLVRWPRERREERFG